MIAHAEPFDEIAYERFISSSADVEAEILPDRTLQVVLAAGAKGSPGVLVLPDSGEVLDFSNHSRIEAVIQNTGDTAVPVSLRVDNKGHWKEAPWSTESIRLEPGQTGTVVVFFGRSHGMKSSFALDRSKVTQLLLFAPGAEQSRRFVVKSISSAGEPDETPDEWRKKSVDVLVDGVLLGPEVPLRSASQLSSYQGSSVTGTESGEGLAVHFTGTGQSVSLRSVRGMWDLRAANRLEVEVRNTGRESIWPGIQIESTKGATGIARTDRPVGAGAKAIIQVPFSSSIPWRVAEDESSPVEGSGTEWVSKAATAVTFLSGGKEGTQTFEVSRIQAVAPSVVFPNWVGMRPPVEGDWVQTLNEEFDEPSLNEAIWNTATTNHWDKKTGFSRDNVRVEKGAARLRFEHRTARHNDDPQGEEKAYMTGFLDTFGKWKQCYGYFEARMKLPNAPGLWPAFWMMPDRGPETAPRWKREQTTNGGMEFDIMEYLSGWGPYRYNVAFHWDGYGKNHLLYF